MAGLSQPIKTGPCFSDKNAFIFSHENTEYIPRSVTLSGVEGQYRSLGLYHKTLSHRLLFNFFPSNLNKFFLLLKHGLIDFLVHCFVLAKPDSSENPFCLQ